MVVVGDGHRRDFGGCAAIGVGVEDEPLAPTVAFVVHLERTGA